MDSRRFQTRFRPIETRACDFAAWRERFFYAQSRETAKTKRSCGASCLNQMAGQHIFVQLYVEYLERGGKPIRGFEEEDE